MWPTCPTYPTPDHCWTVLLRQVTTRPGTLVWPVLPPATQVGLIIISLFQFLLKIIILGPLSALHTMTDMKAAAMLSQAASTNYSKSSPDSDAPVSPSPPSPSCGATPTSPTTPHTVNPHGIDSILNRRTAGLPGLSLVTSSSSNVSDNLSTTMSR